METISRAEQDLDHVKKYDRIFLLSRFSGVFPFSIRTNGISLSWPTLVISAVVTSIPYISFGFLENHSRLYKNIVTSKFYFLSYIFPIFCLYSVTPCSIVWLYFKTAKLKSTFDALRRVELTTGRDQHVVLNIRPILSLVLMLPAYFGELYLFGETYIVDICTYASFISLYSVILVISQFTAVLSVIKGNYEYLSDTVDLSRAEDWLRCHEILGQCCQSVSECYSPQLLLIIMLSFVYVVFHTFIIIMAVKGGIHHYGNNVFIYWVFFFSLLTWYIVYKCRYTKLEVINYTVNCYC